MKIIHISILILLAAIYTASAQLPTPPKKPPVGVPADAQLFNGKWYRIYIEKLPWNSARQRCTTLGGQLAVIPNEPTWVFIRKLADGQDLWLGATDVATEGLWTWIDGTPFKFKAWNRREPNNMAGKEHYLTTAGDGWNDVQRSGQIWGRQYVLGFICQWRDK